MDDPPHNVFNLAEEEANYRYPMYNPTPTMWYDPPPTYDEVMNPPPRKTPFYKNYEKLIDCLDYKDIHAFLISQELLTFDQHEVIL